MASYKSLFLLILSLFIFDIAAVAHASSRVPLQDDNGVYVIPVRLNDVVTLGAIVDSGASELQIPADVVLTLIRSGTVTSSDFLPGATYILADGSKVKGERFTLRKVQVGDIVIDDVPAAISSVSSTLLLGQSFLSRFRSWSIDNASKELIVDSNPMLHTQPAKIGIESAPPVMAEEIPITDPTNLETPDPHMTEWGVDAQATLTQMACSDPYSKSKGFTKSLYISVPSSTLKNQFQAWSVSSGRAVIIKGCWQPVDERRATGLLHRKDGDKIWEHFIDLTDGSWRLIR